MVVLTGRDEEDKVATDMVDGKAGEGSVVFGEVEWLSVLTVHRAVHQRMGLDERQGAR
jgi:hypothetical protein